MSKIVLGKIVNTYGLKGELKLLVDPDYGDLEFEREAIIIIADKEYRFYHYTKKKNLWLISLMDHQDINLVEHLVNSLVVCDLASVKTLPKGSYYSFQLIGLSVFSLQDELLGEIIKVEDSGYQKTLRLTSPANKEILIPWVDFFVKQIDLSLKIVRVAVIEGLI